MTKSTVEYEFTCTVVSANNDQNFYVLLDVKDGELVKIHGITELRAHLYLGLVFFFGSMFSLVLTQLL